MDPHKETKTIGLRITGEPEYCLEKFKQLNVSNPYMYTHHEADDGVKARHTHFSIIRDWNGTHAAVTKKLKSDLKFQEAGLKNPKHSCAVYALSIYENTLLWNGQYLSHGDAEIVYVGDEWSRVKACNPKLVNIKKEKPDKPIEERQRDKDHIPLTLYNLVPTMQRYDRLHRAGKRTFQECYMDLVTNTRYRPGRELLTKGIPPGAVKEYELGVRRAAEKELERALRKGRKRGKRLAPSAQLSEF